MKKKIIRNTCVLCNSKKIKIVLNLGKTPLANSYPKSINTKEEYFNLRLALCVNCSHLQLIDIVNPKLLFENYLYVSGTSPVFKDHFTKYANKIIKKFNLDRPDNVLDIAANDGTFLNCFKNKDYDNLLAIDPAKNLAKINKEKKIKIISSFFNLNLSHGIKKKYGKFKIITANNVCAHVPKLKNFFLGVKNILKENGIFIFEVSYLLDVCKKITFDTIYHEHMSYHSLKPLVKFCKSLDLEIFDFDLVKAHGGSIRIYASHKNQRKIKINKIENQINKEISFGLFRAKTYKLYHQKILKVRDALKKIISSEKLNNNKIIGYGCPAKLTTFMHVLDISKNDVMFIIDDNPLKQGRLVPGKKIKILNQKEAIRFNPDLVIIFAWNFFDNLSKVCYKIFKKNVIIVNPFPKPKVYKKN